MMSLLGSCVVVGWSEVDGLLQMMVLMLLNWNASTNVKKSEAMATRRMK